MAKWTKPRHRRPPWRPLAPAEKVPPSPERIAAMRAEAASFGMTPDEAEQLLLEPGEFWKNERYTVIVKRHADGFVTYLSIRRNDREPDIGWRDLQRIKTQLAGAETEAVELFPAESRLMDTANQRWLWCLPPGERWPFGFHGERHVSGPEEAARLGARQAPLPIDTP